MNNDSPTLLTAEMALHLAEMMELSEEYNGMDADERRFSKALRSLASGKTECRVVGTDEVEPFVVRHYTSDERPTIKGNGFDGLEVGETREDAETFVAWLNAALRGRVVGAVPADVEGLRERAAAFSIKNWPVVGMTLEQELDALELIRDLAAALERAAPPRDEKPLGVARGGELVAEVARLSALVEQMASALEQVARADELVAAAAAKGKRSSVRGAMAHLVGIALAALEAYRATKATETTTGEPPVCPLDVDGQAALVAGMVFQSAPSASPPSLPLVSPDRPSQVHPTEHHTQDGKDE